MKGLLVLEDGSQYRGDAVGRPRKLTQNQLEHAQHLIETKDESVKSVARSLRVSRATLYRNCREARARLVPH